MIEITDTNLMVFDWETSGTLPEYALQPWRIPQRKMWGTTLAHVHRRDGESVVKGGVLASDDLPQAEVWLRNRKAAKEMLEEAIDLGLILGGWNTAFDVSILIALGLERLVRQLRYVDGLLLWRHFFVEPEYDTDRNKKRSYGLKEFVRENLPKFAGYEEEIDFHDTRPETRARLHQYNVRDCIATYAGIRLLWERLSPAQRVAAAVEARAIPIAAGANYRGLPVDVLATKELKAHLTDVAQDRLHQLRDDGVTEQVVRSPTQLAKLMFDEWELPVLKENVGKKTKAVSRATDKEVLHELKFQDPRVKLLHEYREALGNRTKFADNILASVNYNQDGCVHPNAIIFGTYTSRLTYASKQGKNKAARPIGFAIHQEKRGPLYRSALTAPPGHDLGEFDASGQEFRWMAILSGDETMLALCQPGEDPHSFMAAEIQKHMRVTKRGGAPLGYRELMDLVAKEDKDAEFIRKGGKFADLSCQYRTGPRKLLVKARVDYDLPLTLDEAKIIHKVYHETFAGVPKYQKAQIKKCRELGYAETLAGRRVQLLGDWEGPMGWSLQSTAINYPIQGTGGEQKYLALACLDPLMAELDVKFGWDLHDGLYFFIPKANTQTFMSRAKKILDNLPYEKVWGFKPPIPLPWDAKVGGSWGSLRGWKP